MIRAKFLNKVKQIILERDIVCVFCGKQGSDFHHVLFGTESNYKNNRNAEDQGVLTCRDCHGLCHGTRKGEGLRQEAINYLNNFYDRWNQ